MVAAPEIRVLAELTAFKGALPALAFLSREEANAKQLSEAIGVSEETAGALREHFLRLKLVQVTEVPAGGARALVIGLTAKGRRAAACSIELAKCVM